MLDKEYAAIIKDGVIRENFVKAVNTLRDIDTKVAESPQTEEAIGAIALPWIDREEIDRRMGIPPFPERGVRGRRMTGTWDEYAKRRDWRKRWEDRGTGDEVIKNLHEKYEWSMIYIRALALMNADLRAEKNLEVLTRLHEELVNNKGISYTEEDYFFSYYRNVFVNNKTKVLLEELGHDRKEIMTGEGRLLPWIKVRDEWFDLER